MKWRAVATDYDGTLARDGAVDRATLDALVRFRSSGRALVMVTGRELADLEDNFPSVQLFDRIVAENGALLFDPRTRAQRPLGPPPPPEFVRALRARGVTPLAMGRGILATRVPNDAIVLEVIRSMGLELQVIFNKGAVMVVSSGVNKATGLAVALESLAIPASATVGVGDAENDHSFLHACGLSVAVANALPALRTEADWVTTAECGAGVIEVLEAIVTDDAREHPPR
jgi:hydroxymethylpyrimidine pyrophosphatase-like HAD family hydrolase